MNRFSVLRWRHFHFLLLAVYIWLFFYNRNAAYFPRSSIIYPLGMVIGVSLFFGGICFLFCRRLEVAALAAFFLTLLFLAFGHLVYGLGVFLPSLAGNWLAQILILIFGILFIVKVCVILLRLNPPLEPANRYLTIVFLFLLGLQILLLAKTPTQPERVSIRSSVAKTLPSVSRSNVYVIVLDAYARTDTLRSFFDFDDSAFLKDLDEMGFKVGRLSVSSYFLSALSMASTFNLDYIQNLDLAQTHSAFDLMPVNDKLDHSRTRKILGEFGYTFVSTPSLFPPIECVEADVYVENNLAYDNMLFSFLDTTALRLLYSNQLKYRDFVLKNLENIPSLAEGHSPAFVYTHITLPHPPFVFTSEGKPAGGYLPISFNDGADFYINGQTKETYAAGYRGQVQFLNRKIPTILRELLRKDQTDPYIILMSDHGPRMLFGDRTQSRPELLLTAANLLAVRAPKGVKVPESALFSPINTMRFVNSQITGLDLPPIPRRVYLSYGDTPYTFEDVTSKVEGLWEDE